MQVGDREILPYFPLFFASSMSWVKTVRMKGALFLMSSSGWVKSAWIRARLWMRKSQLSRIPARMAWRGSLVWA